MPRIHNKEHTVRIKIIGFLIIFAIAVLLVRMFTLQILQHDFFVTKAQQIYVSQSSIFDRGSIFLSSREGSPLAVASIMRGSNLAIDPTLISNPESVFSVLEPFLSNPDRENFIEKANQKNLRYREIESRVDSERTALIRNLNLRGVSTNAESWRYYPGEGLFSHALGFVAFDQNDLVGRYGLERFYDSVLSRNNQKQNINIFAEVFGNFGKSVEVFDVSEEENLYGDIVTTVEVKVQQNLEYVLKNTIETFDASGGFGVVINPQDGSVYAMASFPTYNNNEFNRVSDMAVFRNPVIENIYEFGSVIKPLVIAAGIDVNAITAETTYFDNGFIKIEDATIRNFDGRGRGTVTMRDILADSLNTGMVFSMQQMGRDNLRKYLLDFGIGERTGIDLPGEARGITSNLRSPRQLEYATASFGQGISTTPIALMRALSALGNGGYLVQPHVVRGIYDSVSGQPLKEFSYSKLDGGRVISQKTSEEITRMMVSIVDKNLGGGSFAIPGYSIAAKTGTAQIPNPQGGYYEDRNLHSLVGYFPAYEPEFLILLSLEHPKNVQFASQSLGTPFFDLVDFFIRYYNIPPDRAS